MRRVYCQLWPLRLYYIFPHYLIKTHDFRKKNVIEHEKCILIPSATSVQNVSQSKKRCARYEQKCILVFMLSIHYSCQILMKLEFSRHIFEKYSNITYNGNLSNGSWVLQCGQIDGRTDRHDEANRRFSQFCEGA
jgi:hypothetical protein